MNRIALSVALALSLSTGCAGTFGAHSKPKAGARTEPTCEPSYAAPIYLAGVALATFGLAYAIDSSSTPQTAEADQREMVGLGAVTGAATVGALWTAHRAGKCHSSIAESVAQ